MIIPVSDHQMTRGSTGCVHSLGYVISDSRTDLWSIQRRTKSRSTSCKISGFWKTKSISYLTDLIKVVWILRNRIVIILWVIRTIICISVDLKKNYSNVSANVIYASRNIWMLSKKKKKSRHHKISKTLASKFRIGMRHFWIKPKKKKRTVH